LLFGCPDGVPAALPDSGLVTELVGRLAEYRRIIAEDGLLRIDQIAALHAPQVQFKLFEILCCRRVGGELAGVEIGAVGFFTLPRSNSRRAPARRESSSL
jgi:hypothetical protein